MSKAPAFQFYVGDWMKDPELRSVSLEARGLWIDLLCLMWDSVERGYLVARNSLAFRNEHIARMVGAPEGSIVELVNELEETGVFSRDDRGAIYCRRMVRDAQKSAQNAENGRKGGLKKAESARNSLGKKPSETVANPLANDLAKPSPSSSSSSSSSVSTPQPPKGGKGARKKMTSTEVLAELDFGELSNYTEYIDEFGKWIAHRMGYRRPQCGWVEFFTEQLRKLELMSPSTAFLTVQRSRVNGYQGLIEPGPRTPPTGTNGTNGATGGSKAVYALKAKQDAVKEELKAIDDRTSHVATGPLYTADDKARRRELGEMLGKLNRELASV